MISVGPLPPADGKGTVFSVKLKGNRLNKYIKEENFLLSLPEENQLDQVNILFLDFPAEFFEFSLMRHIFLVRLKLFVLCKKKNEK